MQDPRGLEVANGWMVGGRAVVFDRVVRGGAGGAEIAPWIRR